MCCTVYEVENVGFSPVTELFVWGVGGGLLMGGAEIMRSWTVAYDIQGVSRL